MDNIVLRKILQDALLSKELNLKLEEETEEVSELHEGCCHFYFFVHGNTYYLAKTFDQLIKRNNISSSFIEDVQSFVEATSFNLNDLDIVFLDFYIKNHNSCKSNLDDEIFQVLTKFIGRFE